jgi:hypothetical protein
MDHLGARGSLADFDERCHIEAAGVVGSTGALTMAESPGVPMRTAMPLSTTEPAPDNSGLVCAGVSAASTEATRGRKSPTHTAIPTRPGLMNATVTNCLWPVVPGLLEASPPNQLWGLDITGLEEFGAMVKAAVRKHLRAEKPDARLRGARCRRGPFRSRRRRCSPSRWRPAGRSGAHRRAMPWPTPQLAISLDNH